MLINKKSCLAILSVVILSVNVSAQKKQFTMAEAVNGMSTTLAPQGVKQPSWEPGTNKLYQVVKTSNGDAWISTKFPEAKTDTVLRLKELNDKVFGTDKLKSLPALKWLEESTVYFTIDSVIRKGIRTAQGFEWYTWLTLPGNAANVTVDKSGQIAYTVDNNLWLFTKDKKTIQLTDDKDPNIINGQAVHRNEWGIDGGIFFSPNGNYVAYYHMDQTMVNDYPVIDWSAMPAKNKNIKYPMAGDSSHHVTLKVYNRIIDKTITLQTEGPKDQYLTNICWSPDENYVYIAVLSRNQNQMQLNQYEIVNGFKVKTLFEELNAKYVEPLHPMMFLQR